MLVLTSSRLLGQTKGYMEKEDRDALLSGSLTEAGKQASPSEWWECLLCKRGGDSGNRAGFRVPVPGSLL